MSEQIRIMNITNGDEIDINWETIKGAREWIENQDNPDMYQIMDIY